MKGSLGSSIGTLGRSLRNLDLLRTRRPGVPGRHQFSVGDPGKVAGRRGRRAGSEAANSTRRAATFASGMHAVIVEMIRRPSRITILKNAVVHDAAT